MSQGDAIEPSELANKIAAVMDAYAQRRDMDTRKGFAILPEQQETLFFNKGLQGWYTVKDGVISGRDISINWTLPRLGQRVAVKQIEGQVSIEAIPVKLPQPPYYEIPNNRQPITDVWNLPVSLQDGTTPSWVIQIRFREEAIVQVEATSDTAHKV